MANEYAVNRADLISVADAIRSKGGTSEALAFPDGFVDAVGAIQTGGGSGTIAGSATPAGNLMSNMLYAITSGEMANGDFTLASGLPNTETLIFDSGLSSIKGFLFVNVDWDGVAESGKKRLAFGMALMNPDAGHSEWINNTQTPFLWQYAYSMDDASGINSYMYYSNYNSPLLQAERIRIDGGKLYCTARYNANANYTPFAPAMKYQWFAW